MTIDSSGRLLAFAADFEALCLEFREQRLQPTGQRVVGAVRINSGRARLVPYDGAYPIYKLKIELASDGIVTGTGINCGPDRADCTETYAAASTVMLDAMPLAGYRFLGWSGACGGPSTTSVAIEWIHACRAFFSPIVPAPGPDDARVTNSTLLIQSEIGDPIGLGRGKILVTDSV